MKKTDYFVGRCFHGKNQCDIVALMPAEMSDYHFKYPSGAGDLPVQWGTALDGQGSREEKLEQQMHSLTLGV